MHGSGSSADGRNTSTLSGRHFKRQSHRGGPPPIDVFGRCKQRKSRLDTIVFSRFFFFSSSSSLQQPRPSHRHSGIWRKTTRSTPFLHDNRLSHFLLTPKMSSSMTTTTAAAAMAAAAIPAAPVTGRVGGEGNGDVEGILEFEDGTAYRGVSFGAEGKSISGECVFQTGAYSFFFLRSVLVCGSVLIYSLPSLINNRVPASFSCRPDALSRSPF